MKGWTRWIFGEDAEHSEKKDGQKGSLELSYSVLVWYISPVL